MTTKTKTLLVMLLASALPCVADRLLIQFRTEVSGFAIDTARTGEPSRVLFTSAPGVLTVSIVVANAPGGAGKASESYELVSTQWWSALSWHLERENNGKYTPLQFSPGAALGEPQKPNRVRALQPGDQLTARFRLPALEPGVYHLYAELAGLISEGDWFRVSTGRENDEMRIAYARFRIENSRDRDERRRYLLELAHLDRLNAGAWIELGDLSLVDGSAAEVQKYYDTAIQLFDERRNLFASRGSDSVVDQIDREQGALRQLKTILPNYFEHRETLQLSVDVHGAKRYILVERKSQRVLSVINVGGPEIR